MTTDHDDWDAHWSNYGDTSGALNPANRMRERLILSLLGEIAGGSTILDIGSGQGDLAFVLADRYPDAKVIGVEYSSEGVKRARRAAESRSSGVTFLERNLLEAVPAAEASSVCAQYATCSEVLEHVDDPVEILTNAKAYLAPGCRVVFTVPGGPRSAFDRHIGHRQHFTPASLTEVIDRSGLEVIRTARAGFPFFNVYKSLVIARGKKLVADVEKGDSGETATSPAIRAVLRALDTLFHANLPAGPLGWQIVATARVP
ncbi:MAG TPA: class I SAM-dependent methyltransferase [Acidimicrobiales bacterium]|jgi:2-polyprenyl-3-methyl-5-hydroxy-6-metoxy-1,4-benzoquinol methylase|nr:class I SAM-dependent methyltransferase [Acidimicrobiales bacterium]